MWFTPQVNLAHAYHRNALRDGARKVFTYVVQITGNILTSEELEKACEDLGIDHYDYVAYLVSNPKQASKHPDTASIVEHTGCDGFVHDDYDPRNFSRDVDSIFVINPAKSVKILEKIVIPPKDH